MGQIEFTGSAFWGGRLDQDRWLDPVSASLPTGSTVLERLNDAHETNPDQFQVKLNDVFCFAIVSSFITCQLVIRY